MFVLYLFPLGESIGRFARALLTCLVCLRRRTRSITNERSPGRAVMGCCHGITQAHLGVSDDFVGPGRPLGRRHDAGGVETFAILNKVIFLSPSGVSNSSYNSFIASALVVATAFVAALFACIYICPLAFVMLPIYSLPLY